MYYDEGIRECEDCGILFYSYEELEKHISEKRRVEKKDIFGEFVETKFHYLKKGDVFKLYEPDGTPVVFKGYFTYIALSNAYVSGNSWTIDTREWRKEDE